VQNKTKPSIGVVAISYNEGIDLPGFIDCLIEWVDEIVIIDDGSTDNSVEIIESYQSPKIKFIVSPRNKGEYYADQRNKGIKTATTDWLLHMDIDERVTPELRVEIIQDLELNKSDAFRFRRLNYFLGKPMKGGGWADWNKVHLAKREALLFTGMYHEGIDLVPNTRVGQLRSKMIHLNDKDYKERLFKSYRYLEEIKNNMAKIYSDISLLRVFWLGIRDFILKFVWKKGFLDGKLGFIWALHGAMAQWKAAIWLWDEQSNKSGIR
jgi:(heptosyl)LPS beta-1,4-glucosyltransferase